MTHDEETLRRMLAQMTQCYLSQDQCGAVITTLRCSWEQALDIERQAIQADHDALAARCERLEVALKWIAVEAEHAYDASPLTEIAERARKAVGEGQ